MQTLTNLISLKMLVTQLRLPSIFQITKTTNLNLSPNTISNNNNRYNQQNKLPIGLMRLVMIQNSVIPLLVQICHWLKLISKISRCLYKIDFLMYRCRILLKLNSLGLFRIQKGRMFTTHNNLLIPMMKELLKDQVHIILTMSHSRCTMLSNNTTKLDPKHLRIQRN